MFEWYWLHMKREAAVSRFHSVMLSSAETTYKLGILNQGAGTVKPRVKLPSAKPSSHVRVLLHFESSFLLVRLGKQQMRPGPATCVRDPAEAPDLGLATVATGD